MSYDLDAVHETGEERTFTQTRAYAVYKDYDGNAPDTQAMVFVATQDLAKEVCGFLTDYASRSQADQEQFMLDVFGESCTISLPWSDGWEWCSRYTFHETWVVCPTTTLRKVIEHIRD